MGDRQRDWSGWTIGDQQTLSRLGRSGEELASIYQINESGEPGEQIFKAILRGKRGGDKVVHREKLPWAIAWCEQAIAQAKIGLPD